MKIKFYNISLMIISVAVLYGNHLMAQDIDTMFSFQIRKALKGLNKNLVTYGLLKEASLEQMNLFRYRGVVLADSNLVDAQVWYDLYSTLAMSQVVNTPAATLKHPQLVDSIWLSNRKPGQITVAGLFYGYGKFKDNAKSLLVNSYGTLYHRIINYQIINPFTNDLAIAFAPGNNEYYGLSFNLLLPEELWLSNLKPTVTQIQVDMNDGLGYRQVLPNIPLPVQYADSGIKHLKFRVKKGLFIYYYTHAKIKVKLSQYYKSNEDDPLPIPEFKKMEVQSFVPPVCIAGNSNPEMLIMGSTEFFEGLQAVGQVTIRYSKPDKKLRKPLIIVEGLDVGQYVNPEDPRGTLTIEGFILSLQDNPTLLNLIDSDYDLIYVDWKYGAANLKLNALLLKTLIRCVNQTKIANGLGEKEKNVILGESMGGVISRYALKKMEDDGEDHETRLFISHDAPHQGANVPLGFQALAIHLQKIASKATLPIGIFSLFSGPKYKLLLLNHTPAAKQLLVNRLNYNYEIDNTEYNSFQAELKALGYPQNCRNISISNGSECGKPLPISPGSNLFYLNGNMYPGAIADIFGCFIAPFAALLTGQPELLLGIIPGSSSFKFHFQSNSMADGGANKIYYSKVSYFKMLAFLVPIQVTITQKTYFSPPNMFPTDQFPGGYFHLGEYKKDFSSNNLNYSLGLKAGFSFISTPSALDIGQGWVPLEKNDYYAPYLSDSPPPAPKNSPFQNYITAFSSGQNEKHITYTSRNSNWLVQELNNAGQSEPNCAELCGLEVIGSTDCLKSGATFQVTNLPVGATIKWTVTGLATILGSNNLSTVTINSLGIGTANLQVTITTPTCTSTLSKVLSNELPLPPIIDYSVILPFPGMWTCQFWVTNYEPGYVYNWYINGVPVYSTTNNFFQYNFGCGYLAFTSVKCVKTTDCASSPFGNILYLFPPACNFNIYPNPADDFLNIDIIEQDDRLISADELEVQLYDHLGKMVMRYKFRNDQNSLRLETSTFTDGLYYLHIKHGDQVIKKQVIIQH